MLSDRWFESFDGRCQWVRDQINRRTKPILWASYELAQLDHKLRDFIKKETAKRRWMRLRADWYGSRDYLQNVESISWEPCLNPYSTKSNAFLLFYFHNTLQLIKLLYESKR